MDTSPDEVTISVNSDLGTPQLKKPRLASTPDIHHQIFVPTLNALRKVKCKQQFEFMDLKYDQYSKIKSSVSSSIAEVVGILKNANFCDISNELVTTIKNLEDILKSYINDNGTVDCFISSDYQFRSQAKTAHEILLGHDGVLEKSSLNSPSLLSNWLINIAVTVEKNVKHYIKNHFDINGLSNDSIIKFLKKVSLIPKSTLEDALNLVTESFNVASSTVNEIKSKEIKNFISKSKKSILPSPGPKTFKHSSADHQQSCRGQSVYIYFWFY